MKHGSYRGPDRRSASLPNGSGLFVLLLAAAGLLLGAPQAQAGDLATVKSRGKLVMLTYPVQGTHFSSINVDVMREQGLKLQELRKPAQFDGVDVELMAGFARSLGVELEIHALAGGYGVLLPSLNEQQGDLVASELTITPRRQAMADFSEPYVRNWIAVVVRRDSQIAAVGDLAGKRGAVLSGSSHIEFVAAAAPSARIQQTGFDLESLDAVESGGADFALMDTSAPPGQPVDTLHPDLMVAFRLRQIGDGVAVRKGSDLLAPLNAYLTAVERSGELKRILERHGFSPTDHAAAVKP
jgi:ABC-type amino acid transport substrate-binding protein